ncbi:MAG: TIGR04283 family arsenosugar biosynthesis glycosyltransferase [Acidiferrobacterales bacterium]|nr:TIGR04283 family arsenosugar biosynthesis glycosyltransferase [Acidiferrobacterales bacterium]
MRLSIIIPTLNERDNVRELVTYLQKHGDERIVDLIVVDGGSTDDTVAAAEAAGATVYTCPQRGRAVQMNMGAEKASGDVLYFVHADACPPPRFLDQIEQALGEGYDLGCYRFVFKSNRLLLRINAYFTRFDRLMCRGGDQTLFVRHSLFDALGGYKPHYVVMEDYDFILRARKQARFKIIPDDVLVSARKYKHNSYLRVNLSNLTVFIMFFLGFPPRTMLATYRRLINHPKP